MLSARRNIGGHTPRDRSRDVEGDSRRSAATLFDRMEGAIGAEGLKVIWCGEADLDLLEPRRMLQDEGIFRCLKIACNVLKDWVLRQRILAIRRIFQRYREHLGAISIIGIRKSGLADPFTTR